MQGSRGNPRERNHVSLQDRVILLMPEKWYDITGYKIIFINNVIAEYKFILSKLIIFSYAGMD